MEIYDNYIDNIKENQISIDSIVQYLKSVIETKKEKEIYTITKKIISTIKKEEDLLTLGYLFYNSKKYDMIFLLFQDNHKSDKSKILLAKTYLITGEIEKSAEIFKDIISTSKSQLVVDYANKKLIQINNNKNYGSFLKIDYDAFLKKGYKLEPGHVVYFKENVLSFLDSKSIFEDPKHNNRPYLIVHINNYKLTLFPLTTHIKDKRYTFRKESYPNIGKDRQIKANIVNQYSYNIDAVYDKISKYDYDIAIKQIFNFIYLFSKEKNKDEFLKTYIGKPQKNDIIKIPEKDSNNNKKFNYIYYFIIDISFQKKSYKVIEIDPETHKTIGNMKYINQDTIPFDIINLSNEEIISIIRKLKFDKEEYNIGIPKKGSTKDKYDIAMYINEGKKKYGLILSASNTRYAICYINPKTHKILSNVCILKKEVIPDKLYKLSDEDVEIYKIELRKALIDSENLLKTKKK